MQDFNHSPDFRIREIMARPVWNFDDLCLIFGMPRSTLELTIKQQPIPGMFIAGRRRHVQRDNALAWLTTLETTNAYQPRLNNPREKVAA